MDTCKYRHIFGKEGQGVHSLRVFNIAIVDLALTLAAAYGIAKYMEWNLAIVFVAIMIIAVLVHKAFCVETTLTKLVFP